MSGYTSFFLIAVAVVLGTLLVATTTVRANDLHVCGSELTRTMEIVCEGKYQGLFSKRSTVTGAKTRLGRLIELHHAQRLPFYHTLPSAYYAVLRNREQEQADNAVDNTDTIIGGYANSVDDNVRTGGGRPAAYGFNANTATNYASVPTIDAAAEMARQRRAGPPRVLDWYVDQSIVTECCDRVCSFKQMLAYCSE